MDRKVTRIRIRFAEDSVRLGFDSANRAGTTYSVGSAVVDTRGLGRAQRKTALEQAIENYLEGRGAANG